MIGFRVQGSSKFKAFLFGVLEAQIQGFQHPERLNKEGPKRPNPIAPRGLNP